MDLVRVLAFACMSSTAFLAGCHTGARSSLKATPRFPIEVNGKWGFIDSSGKIAIPPQFDGVDAQGFSEGLAPVCLGRCAFVEIEDSTATPKPQVYIGKWGYVDVHGALVVTPQFTGEGKFSHGLAYVVEGENRLFAKSTIRYGYIDAHGTRVIPTQFDEAYDFSENGLAAACVGDGDDRRCGFINRGGRFVVNPRFWIVDSFHDGLASFQERKKGPMGYIDAQGRVVWQPSE